MIKIGITGGVGCGKSKVLTFLAEHTHGQIIMADEVGHLVKEKGTCCYEQLIRLLGEDILKEDGSICRVKMAQRIFSDPAMLKKVNEIIHPAVKEYILQAMTREEKEVLFLESALLLEAGYAPFLDEIWYIYSEDEVRKERLRLNRGYSEEKIRQIMDSQLKKEQFQEQAKVVIDNSGNFQDTERQLKREIERLGLSQRG